MNLPLYRSYCRLNLQLNRRVIILGKYNKEEKSWMMYDWASSAYSIIITTAIFPIYYKAVADNAGVNQADSTAYLGYTISISTFILALLGPILGTLADYQGMKGKFFNFFFHGDSVHRSIALYTK